VSDSHRSLRNVADICLKCRVYFPALSDQARRETDTHQPVIRTKHYIGRLAIYSKTVKALVDGALELPCVLYNYQLKVCESSQMPSPLNPCDSTLNGIVRRMFPQSSAVKVRTDLEALNIFRDLSQRIQLACDFKTRVHAELLLVDKFRLGGLDFYAGDSYIGCSKPACFCCYYYISGLPERFTVSQCHNKLYTHWRPPDLADSGDLRAAKAREDALYAVITQLRQEVRRYIDERPMRTRTHFDSITGSTSVMRSKAEVSPSTR
jgi:hypothetical protein